MKYIKMLIGALIMTLFVATACEKAKPSEQEETDTTKKIKRVVILGNSIVAHPVKAEIGWNWDWGMAASARDSDFVHLLIAKVHQVDPSVEVQYGNIATFEQGYEQYDFTQLAKYRNADLIIIKISENVDAQTAEKRGFIGYYDKLLDYLNANKKSQVIISDGFWPSPVNDQIKAYAGSKNYPFVSLYDLYRDDPLNSAKGKFANEGVANHPSDQGMRNIATRIWTRMAVYFPANK